MKKLLLGSVALTLFSISIIIFQMSCKKEANAQTGSNYTLPVATTSTLGGVIVGSGLTVSSNGTLSANASSGGGLTQLNKIVFIKAFRVGAIDYGEIWTANYDGTGQAKVNVTFPAGHSFDGREQHIRLSPNGQKVFFDLRETAINKKHIFSCNIDGTNVLKIIDGTGLNLDFITVQGAY